MTYQHKCQVCGCEFTNNAPNETRYCRKCKKVAARDTKRRYDARTYGSYWVLYDPDPVAGFHKGMKVSREENINMLRMSCFTPGTLLKSVDGICYEVVQKVTKQALVECQKGGA